MILRSTSTSTHTFFINSFKALEKNLLLVAGCCCLGTCVLVAQARTCIPQVQHEAVARAGK
jgi:hypothetical protein